ncbi:unnamed protein product [Macrosiphum euphorbiae]|uniref:Uncharacterized protein n=1 Tax=Macrosiphum euphorbiae TaxID=13131 RepID=A0AAV0WEX5_9HEMI|nr:unnamed protein product [Macrosiphum euphorbiae]
MSKRIMSQQSFDIKLITVKRGNLLVLFNNFNYNKNIRYASGEIKWRCNNKYYNAFIKTIGGSNIIYSTLKNSSSDTLCLPISNQILERQEISNCVKKTVEDIRHKPSKYFSKNK